MTGEDFLFKKGTYGLHPHANFNFQLNRLVMWSGADLEEVEEAARKITDLRSWVSTFLALGEKALQEGRTRQAIAYLRGAEFFIYEDIEEKRKVGERVRELFYEYHSHIFEDGAIERDEVPYGEGLLPVWIARPDCKEKGTILLHGG